MRERVYRCHGDLVRQIDATAVPNDAVAMWHLNQESMVFKGGNHIVYVDPYLTNYVEDSGLAGPKGSWERGFPSPLAPELVTNATVVLITHHHLDHLDPTSLGPISRSSPQAVFVCPVPHVGLLLEAGICQERIVGARADEMIQLDGLEIHPIPGAHEELTTDEQGNHLYLGYVFFLNGCVIYHAGDTVGYPELPQRLKAFPIDVACHPINGRDYSRFVKGIAGNMNHREAVDLAVEINADLLIPIHYDLYPLNADNPAYFVDYLYQNYPGQKFKMMVPGERLLYLKER